MRSVESVKGKLKNLSVGTGKTMQELLTVYALERTVYRLSISKYSKVFTLKGGIFLYAVYDGNYSRATTDIDLHAQGISNDNEELKNVFTEILSLDADDPLKYDLKSLKVTSITEFKKYHGVNISVQAFLDRTKVLVSIDIGFGDIIYPERVVMDFPVVLSDESPRIYAYSLSSSIAEKFEAIVSLAYDNSRFKDYYDIYVLAKTKNFDGSEMLEALKETFENRHTSFDDIAAFEDGFANDYLRQSRWKAFVKKKKPLLKISLEESIDMLEKFLGPVVEAICEEKSFSLNWFYEDLCWK